MYIDEIFQKTTLNEEKLLKYGFTYKNHNYYYSKKIVDDDFRVDIVINQKKICAKVYDLAFNEEYTNFKIEKETGTFVSRVRNAYKNLLEDIKDKCFDENIFMTNQANRIAKCIKEKYASNPEFLWKKYPCDAIFRNNKKWFGLIMYIGRKKIENKKGNIDILNVKLDEEKIKKLLCQKGFYKAYHMNKEKWITITLDETLSDKEIMEYVSESYKFTLKNE